VARHAGLLIPLFSAASSTSWGIGELADVGPLAAWLSAGGFDRLMLLPLGTMEPGQASPYSAQSAMAIDPIYIAVEGVEDFARAGGLEGLSQEARRQLLDATTSPRVKHASVRAAKGEALDIAYARFLGDEWEQLTPRASALAAYIARERWWLDDYALFQAVAEDHPGRSWREWPAPLRDRDPRALDTARRELARTVLRHQYLQWIADSQWQEARAAARTHGVIVIGDLPFVVDAHSADVWARPHDFLLDVSAGAPPDAFSTSGQDWGLPTYRWDVIRANDFVWLRQRARRMAGLYDGFRVDHLVGFYRTYCWPAGGPPVFSPADEVTQRQQGEAILRVFLESGATIIAEDLGTVPDFVRASLSELGVPGCKVLRWERAWHTPGQPFLDPASFPAVSVTLTGTHDTEPLAVWWDGATSDERAAVLRLPSLTGVSDPHARWSDHLRDALLELAYVSGSDDLFVPVADLFGWRDRINTPATVSEHNWTWRLPWSVDRLDEPSEAIERAAFAHALAQRTGRAHVTGGADRFEIRDRRRGE
jgi:4-alpha-glucanotransferase